MSAFDRIRFTRHRIGPHRRHFIDEADVRVVLSRLPREVWAPVRRISFIPGRGSDLLGRASRGRREISLCALPPRISLMRTAPPEEFGAVPNSQWPALAVRRLMLYDVLLHELGHLAIVAPRAKRRFASEGKATELATYWRGELWATRFDHPDPVHNPPSEEELAELRAGWREANLAYKEGLAFERAKDPRAACAAYARAVEKCGRHALALMRLGVLEHLGFGTSPSSATDLLRRAIAHDPGLEDAHRSLVRVLVSGEIANHGKIAPWRGATTREPG